MTRRLQRSAGAFLEEAEETAHFRNVPLAAITAGAQPRRIFDEAAMEELAASIRADGLIQPPLLLDLGGTYRIIAGERRVRASRLAGLTEIPAKIVSNLSAQQVARLAVIENLQRQDLNVLDEVEAVMGLLSTELRVERERVSALFQAMRKKPEEYADQIGTVESLFTQLGLGKWSSWASTKFRILTLPEDLLVHLRTGALSESHARLLGGVKDDGQRAEVTAACLEGSWTKKQLSERIAALATPVVATPPVREVREVRALRSRLAALPEARRAQGQALLDQLEALLSAED